MFSRLIGRFLFIWLKPIRLWFGPLPTFFRDEKGVHLAFGPTIITYWFKED